MSHALDTGMTDKLVSSLTAIFVVMLSSGRYSDRHCSPVKSFPTREAADRFLASKEGAVRRLEGMQDAINAMQAEWEKSNPRPDYASDDRGLAYEAWHSFNSIEVERLETITGFRDACKAEDIESYEDVSYISYYINEVPFDNG